MKKKPTEPYYARHKVMELTCPDCKDMLHFNFNERNETFFNCGCSVWVRVTDWATGERRWRHSPAKLEKESTYDIKN